MLTSSQKFQKRVFDFILSLFGLFVLWPLILLSWMVAAFETKSNGFFLQARIGKHGKPFHVLKIKTMKPIEGMESTVTTSNDRRITKSGAFFRKTKIDELPQLWNVLLGNMSFVGPRPDVSGFADQLEGEDREILKIAPGITGPASLKYQDEEAILAKHPDPEVYNKEVIWPDKVRINREYLHNWSLSKDLHYMIKTVLG